MEVNLWVEMGNCDLQHCKGELNNVANSCAEEASCLFYKVIGQVCRTSYKMLDNLKIITIIVSKLILP